MSTLTFPCAKELKHLIFCSSSNSNRKKAPNYFSEVFTPIDVLILRKLRDEKGEKQTRELLDTSLNRSN